MPTKTDRPATAHESDYDADVAVLALDAADWRLVNEWDCTNLLLDRAAPLKTEAFTSEYPSTKEVWPTIATGLHPDEHGLTLVDGDSNPSWDSSTLSVASRVAEGVLPQRIRTQIGRWLHDRTEQSLPQTDAEHVFDHARGWMGITPAHDLARAHDLWSQIQSGDLSESELRRELTEQTLTAVQYLATTPGIHGDHIHTLDVAGHTYARRRGGLCDYYQHMGRLIGWLRHSVDELVIVSDHGMQVEWLDDDEPGQHSMRAMVAATEGVTGDLPETIFDVADWLAAQENAVDARRASMDATDEQLEALGYK